MRQTGPCGWCLTGQCCTAPGSWSTWAGECTHCRRCGIYEEGATMPAGPSIIQQIWNQLDEEVDEIIDIATQKERVALQAASEPTPHAADTIRLAELNVALATAKGRARGKAEALALLMPPYFRTADEISQESMVRKAHRDAGQPYVSPGLSRGNLGHRLQHAALVDQALDGVAPAEG